MPDEPVTPIETPAEPVAAPVEPAAEPTPVAEEPKPAEPAKPEEAKPAVPEKYDFKAPEGQEFDPEVMAAYSDVARELGMSQEAAQKMLDKVGPVLDSRREAQINAQITATRQAWLDATKADAEVGGSNLEASLATANKVIASDKFTTPEFRKFLSDSGLGNHVEFVKTFTRIGKLISEDTYVGGAKHATPDDRAERMYPSMKRS